MNWPNHDPDDRDRCGVVDATGFPSRFEAAILPSRVEATGLPVRVEAAGLPSRFKVVGFPSRFKLSCPATDPRRLFSRVTREQGILSVFIGIPSHSASYPVRILSGPAAPGPSPGLAVGRQSCSL
ncbi:hypothetical protein E1301_Tti004377 [Triplophysa tibetana]|uniref:Uncharacterized protein n=1 Tax=Triplophysa tibetana TaxID=1572043 RepID=A0A5A9N8V6_9TELE|nr:hypothetical protein E1301_Tti004377 [Triplophysa tibetana]